MCKTQAEIAVAAFGKEKLNVILSSLKTMETKALGVCLCCCCIKCDSWLNTYYITVHYKEMFKIQSICNTLIHFYQLLALKFWDESREDGGGGGGGCSFSCILHGVTM